ncbi:nucleotidyltransferase domain-containing protein [Nannocystis pusilla]|uniref:nucleotidyltransferase domain-containing protein n=1 Tax=Nannocystis pusilla TaxID=889268 RepID=UPI00320811EB
MFGSRARGEATEDSDWDLLVVVPDDTPDDELDPLVAWQLRKESAEDLAGARLLAAANNRNAIYLCEQAAEKIIKAVLTSERLHGLAAAARREHRLQDAIDKVAVALTEVAARFGVDLDHPDAPARRPGPIR